MKLHLTTLALTMSCITSHASSQTCVRQSGISSLLSSLMPSTTQFVSPGLAQEYIVQVPSYAAPGPSVVPYVPRQIPVVPNSQVVQTGPLVSNVGYQLGPQVAAVANLPGVFGGGPYGNVPTAIANAPPMVANYPNGKSCGCSAPAPLVSPYLPAQSPVSALAPTTSNCLPAMVPTGSRCNYLRHIPIPPPTC